MAYLAFILITTLSVRDIDFFVDNQRTQLPIVNILIPTSSFFVFAPILGSELYAYLHLHIRKVTEALAKNPTGDPTLEERIKPWLLNDFVLRRRDRRIWHPPFRLIRKFILRQRERIGPQESRAIRPRPMDRLACPARRSDCQRF